MVDMRDCIIIGRGPAGLSAALYTVRAGLDTLIIANGTGALEKAVKIDNYFGFPDTVSGAKLSEDSQKQVLRLGGDFLDAEVIDIRPEPDGSFLVVCDNGQSYACIALLLATGKPRNLPPVKNLEKFEGAGVSRCAVCDGFFYRGKVVGVLGEGKFALSEARELEHLAKTVTIYTNGSQPAFEPSELGGILLDERKIDYIAGENKVAGIVFEDGTRSPIDGLFIAAGVAASREFAAKLGIMTDGGAIIMDKNGATNVPGIFAAGDCAGAPYQISAAVGEGARAGLSIAEYVREKKRASRQ
jgi:thioredoxin reductase (NADPH)